MKQFVEKRLEEMYKTPGMWAVSREAFVMQLLLLTEIAGDKKPRELLPALAPEPSDLGYVLTDDWAQNAVAVARGRILAFAFLQENRDPE